MVWPTSSTATPISPIRRSTAIATTVIDRARQAGARAIVCIGESLAAAERARAVAADHPGFVWFTAGVHPHDAAGFDPIRDPMQIARECATGRRRHRRVRPRLPLRSLAARRAAPRLRRAARARARARPARRRPHARGRGRHARHGRRGRGSGRARRPPLLHRIATIWPRRRSPSGWYVSFSGDRHLQEVGRRRADPTRPRRSLARRIGRARTSRPSPIAASATNRRGSASRSPTSRRRAARLRLGSERSSRATRRDCSAWRFRVSPE